MIVVVGGGVTGLAVGRALDEAGLDFVVLEADTEPGGVIRSAEVDGHVLDWGPQRSRLTTTFQSLVADLDLEPELLVGEGGRDLFIYRDGGLRRVPFSREGLLRSDVVGVGAKLRLLLEPFTAGARPEEPVSAFFARKFGAETYRNVIAPLYGGLYASDPADMEVGIALMPLLRRAGIGRSLLLHLVKRGGIAPAPPCTFRRGMQSLPRAMARTLGSRLRLGARVSGLTRKGDHWAVEVDGSEAVDARDVVLTTPARATAELLSGVAPGAASILTGLRYNPLAIVHLEADTDLEGMGFQVSFDERRMALRGVTFNDSLFGRTDLYTAFLGGSLRPDVATMTDDELATVARDDFRRTTQAEGRVIATRHVAMPAWDNSWKALPKMRLPERIHAAGSWRDRPGLPGRFAEARRVVGSLVEARGPSDPAGRPEGAAFG